MKVFARRLEEYLDDLKSRGRSVSWRASASSVLCQFFDHLEDAGVERLCEITEFEVVSFARQLRDEPTGYGTRLSENTRDAYLSVVKSFLRHIETRGEVLTTVSSSVPTLHRRRLPRALSKSRVRRLLRGPDTHSVKGKRDLAMLEVLYGTGVRMMECIRIDLIDVDLRGATLLVRNGKGRKDRIVPIQGRAREAVDVYLRQSRPWLIRDDPGSALWLSKYGRRLGDVSLRKLVNGYGHKVGVEASCHVLRHSYATHLLEGGASVRQIQKLLGHRSIETTALYTKVDVSKLRDVIDSAHPRARRTKSTR
jgi:integrase/recombinase XerD